MLIYMDKISQLEHHINHNANTYKLYVIYESDFVFISI